MKVEACWAIYKKEHLSQAIDQKRANIAWGHLKLYFGTLPVSQVTQGKVNSYLEYRQASSSTKRRELMVLKAALNWCYKTGHIPSVPYVQVPKESAPKVSWLDKDEIKKLILAAQKFPDTALFVNLMLSTGQRPGAVLGLQWEQVDMKNMVIDFNNHLDPLQARRKGRGIVPIGSGLADALRPLYRNSGPVLDKTGFAYRWKKVVTDAGLPDVTPHVLRHSVATNLCRAGVPLIEISKLLGHKTTAITEKVYITFTPDYCKNAVDTMQAVING